MKVVHFDCVAGISGDMTLGALVDLGVDADELVTELRTLNIEGWELNLSREERCGIYGTQAHVHIREHHHHDDIHHAPHTSWKDIRALIERSGLRQGAKELAARIFSRIAKAEADVHGVPVDDVEFHEVGAVDSIIDICGAAICIDSLHPDKITCGRIELGGGFVRCAHGLLPVPAPAVLALCAGMPVTTGGFPAEMTTPTGAGILAACVDEFTESALFTQLKTGYGIGQRVFDKPNLLRASLREETGLPAGGGQHYWQTETLYLLETNIDDMTAEELGFLMEELFEQGALDVTLTPCIMKKGRPATTLSALVSQEKLDMLQKYIFEKSTSIGVKIFDIQRSSLSRRIETVYTPAGAVRIKTVDSGGGTRSKIEYEDRARYARENNISLDKARRCLETGLQEQNGGVHG